MIKSLLPVSFIFLMTFENAFSNEYNCDQVYAKCFENIPIEMISYFKTYKSKGIINQDNINLRNSPVINLSNNKIVGKLKKNEKVNIKKIFFLKNNTYVDIKLLNSNNIERVNNYRYKKWYLVSNSEISGFVFSDFVNIKKEKIFFDRYRHVDSVNWFTDKFKQIKNIEIVIKKDNSTNMFNLTGYSWHYITGYSEIKKSFPEAVISNKYFQDKDTKIFFFDKDEIYIESTYDIFTGIYKKF